jgi:quinol monooxygenase YgiN
MERLAILATLQAKPGKELDVEALLKSALPMAEAEPGTVRWYALKIGNSTFCVFDTFADRGGLDAHLSGDIAKALFVRAGELFEELPVIGQSEIIALKST